MALLFALSVPCPGNMFELISISDRTDLVSELLRAQRRVRGLQFCVACELLCAKAN